MDKFVEEAKIDLFLEGLEYPNRSRRDLNKDPEKKKKKLSAHLLESKVVGMPDLPDKKEN